MYKKYSEMIKMSKFEELAYMIEHDAGTESLGRELFDAFADTNWDFRCYGLLSFLISREEKAQWHYLALNLLTVGLNYCEGSYNMALIHLRRLIDFEGYTLSSLMTLVDLHLVPESVVSVDEAIWAAREAIRLDPSNSDYAKSFLQAHNNHNDD